MPKLNTVVWHSRATGRIRTDDLSFTKASLCQLSYGGLLSAVNSRSQRGRSIFIRPFFCKQDLDLQRIATANRSAQNSGMSADFVSNFNGSGRDIP